AAPGLVSAQAAQLAEGVLRAMFLNNLKPAVGVLVVLALVALGSVAMTPTAPAGALVAPAPAPEKVAGNPPPKEAPRGAGLIKNPAILDVLLDVDLQKRTVTLA